MSTTKKRSLETSDYRHNKDDDCKNATFNLSELIWGDVA